MKNKALVKLLEKEGKYKQGKTKLHPDPHELAMGIKIEQEHSSDPAVAKQIALDHLTEDPKYYTHLTAMEHKYEKSLLEGNGIMKSKYLLVVRVGVNHPMIKSGVSHPAKLSAPGGNIKSKIPYEGHEERMKLAKMAAARMAAPKPESASKYQPPTVDSKGRAGAFKRPHTGYSDSVGGMGSSAADLFGKPTNGSLADLGAGRPESASAHQPKTMGKPKA